MTKEYMTRDAFTEAACWAASSAGYAAGRAAADVGAVLPDERADLGRTDTLTHLLEGRRGLPRPSVAACAAGALAHVRSRVSGEWRGTVWAQVAVVWVREFWRGATDAPADGGRR